MKNEPVESRQEQAVLNTDREIWRRVPDDYYSPSIHVTEGGGIGMDLGGFVIVLPIETWFKLAKDFVASRSGETAQTDITRDAFRPAAKDYLRRWSANYKQHGDNARVDWCGRELEYHLANFAAQHAPECPHCPHCLAQPPRSRPDPPSASEGETHTSGKVEP